ncbi:MAG: hypothetical protein K8953_11155 [Proteobacteria bacterium]|nr:hypothetical protein [Pseudomonadota bacterium]
MNTDQRTPTGRPVNYPKRLRQFVWDCIADGRIEGISQDDFAALASEHLQHTITVRVLQGQVSALGIDWKEITTRRMRQAIKTMLMESPDFMTVADIHEALKASGFSVIHRTLARRVATIRVEIESDE